MAESFIASFEWKLFDRTHAPNLKAVFEPFEG